MVGTLCMTRSTCSGRKPVSTRMHVFPQATTPLLENATQNKRGFSKRLHGLNSWCKHRPPTGTTSTTQESTNTHALTTFACWINAFTVRSMREDQRMQHMLYLRGGCDLWEKGRSTNHLYGLPLLNRRNLSQEWEMVLFLRGKTQNKTNNLYCTMGGQKEVGTPN